LLDAKHHIQSAAASRLTADDLALVGEIASGRRESPKRERVLALVAAINHPRALELLAQVLLGENEPSLARVAAAAALGRLRNDRDRVEDVLLEGYERSRDLAIRARVASSLCKIGGERSLRLFRVLEEDGSEPLRKLGRFGTALVLHRLGRGARPEVIADQRVAPLAPDITAKFKLTAPPAPLLADVLQTLALDAYGARLSERSTYGIDCDDYSLLCLNAALIQDNQHRLLLRQSLIVGILARRAAEDGTFSTSRVILGGPLDKVEFYLAGYRTDGTPSHVGRGQLRGETLSFDLSATVGERRVVSVKGTLFRDSLEFDQALYQKKGSHGQTPKALKWGLSTLAPGAEGQPRDQKG
jgi:hypothetical protein